MRQTTDEKWMKITLNEQSGEYLKNQECLRGFVKRHLAQRSATKGSELGLSQCNLIVEIAIWGTLTPFGKFLETPTQETICHSLGNPSMSFGTTSSMRSNVQHDTNICHLLSLPFSRRLGKIREQLVC